MISALSKARRVIKIDIVKPMPPKKPAPIIFFHFKSVGNTQSPRSTPINEKSQIPKGFPITSPAIIPKLYVCPKPLSQLSLTAMQVLAIANNGRIKKQLVCARSVEEYMKVIFLHRCQMELQMLIKHRLL